ncbi:MAG: NUDIX hydrolase [Pseudomonadota bacterium]
MSNHPKLAALAVVIRKDQALLVKRVNEPDAGLWGLPGGHIDRGETALDAAVRELKEETCVVARPVRYLTNVDLIVCDGEKVQHHFLLAAVLCEFLSGEPRPRDDVSYAKWWPIVDVIGGKIACSEQVDQVVDLARQGL